MLWMIAAVLLLLWLFGVGMAYTLGSLIHLLLGLALLVVAVRVIRSCQQHV
jgi:hypothetical protein